MSAHEVHDAGEVPADAERLHFECRFREHYAAVMAFALRRTPAREAAEDVAAETFAVAWRRRAVIPVEPLPWLYGIALRIIANQRRSSERRRRLGDRLEHEANVHEVAAEPADAIDRREAFSSAFRRLGENEREVLRLVAWEGLNTREAASALGCSPAAFRVRLYRARRGLAKHLAAAGHSPDERPSEASNSAEETT
jgi:RNA polymerase sigma-70 factor (ECF subfamily)